MPNLIRKTPPMDKLKNNFWCNTLKGSAKYSRRFSIISFCNIAMQAISLVGFIVIARIYHENQIGEYVTYLAYVSILSIISTGPYDQALYIEKGAAYTKMLKLIPVGFVFATSIPIGLGLYFTGVSHIEFILLGVIASGINITALNINIVQNKLEFASLFRLVTSPIVPGVIILGALLLEAGSQLMIAINAIVSLVISIVFYLITSKPKELGLNTGLRKVLPHYIVIIKRYRKFFYYGMIGELIGIAAYRAPVILINNFFGVNYAAYFGIAMRLVISPVSIVCSSVSQLFLHKVSTNRKNNVPSMSSFLKSLSLLTIVGGGVSVLAATIVSPLIVLFFTEQYAIVGEIVYWLIPFIFSLITISPLTSVLTVYEKQEYAFYNKIAMLILSVSSFFIGMTANSFSLGVQFFSFSMMFVYLVILGQIIHVLIKYDSAN